MIGWDHTVTEFCFRVSDMCSRQTAGVRLVIGMLHVRCSLNGACSEVKACWMRTDFAGSAPSLFFSVPGSSSHTDDFQSIDEACLHHFLFGAAELVQRNFLATGLLKVTSNKKVKNKTKKNNNETPDIGNWPHSPLPDWDYRHFIGKHLYLTIFRTRLFLLWCASLGNPTGFAHSSRSLQI